MVNMENKAKFPRTIQELLAENIGATINFCDGKTPKEIIVALLDDYLVIEQLFHFFLNQLKK